MEEALRQSNARTSAAEKALADKNLLYCSFCSKDQHSVRKLIAGRGVFICNECVLLCVEICMEAKPQ
ncbi:hypothetical protein J5283_04015 [Rhizobium sp. 16-488-2a]|nr:hypothetical protein [Rhizobium sp. 16-488-2b]MBO9173321.1 hypothetical protein [Rhizobium sp. 16-488-2a]